MGLGKGGVHVGRVIGSTKAVRGLGISLRMDG